MDKCMSALFDIFLSILLRRFQFIQEKMFVQGQYMKADVIV